MSSKSRSAFACARRALPGLALALVAASSLSAASVPYARSLAKVDAALDAQDWAAAKEQSDDLLRMALERRLAGRNVPLFLAEAFARRALAESASGDADAASWDYHAAAIFDVDHARATAARWPAIALPKLRALLPKLQEPPPEGMLRLADGSFVPFGDHFHFKHSRDEVLTLFTDPNRKQVFYVQIVVGADGRVHEPVAGPPASTCDPFRKVAALETMRYWTFEPAEDADGNPVATIANWTMNLGRQ